MQLTSKGTAEHISLQQDPSIADKVIRGNLKVSKTSADTGTTTSLAGKSVAGAVFEIINNNDNPVISPVTNQPVTKGNVVCEIIAGPDGVASTDNASVNGWSIPTGWGGALPYGQYQIREKSAPEGFITNQDWIESFTISSAGATVSVSMQNTPVAPELGDLSLEKQDADTASSEPAGKGSLVGAKFSITLDSPASVQVGSSVYNTGDVVTTITAAKQGNKVVAATAAQSLPQGTYTVKEVGAGTGYRVNSNWSKQVTIDADHLHINITPAVTNEIMRGDLKLVKNEMPGSLLMPGVPFKITSKTTGERHVIVTDANGIADTSSAAHPHLNQTNANDNATAYNSNAGIWFYGSNSAASTAKEGVGALPYDDYTVEELPCAANAGHLLALPIDVSITQDNVKVDLGRIDNIKQQIGTTLTSGTNAHLVAASGVVELVDKVEYSGLDTSKTYTLKGELHLVDNGVAGDIVATSEQSLKPTTSSGTAEVRFSFDVSALGGKSVVAFETLMLGNTKIAEHVVPTSPEQTVWIPKIGTSLIGTGNEHIAPSSVASVLVDTVSYSGLQPGKTYKMKGTLMDKATSQPVKDAAGNEIVATSDFTPTESSGTVEIKFQVDGRLLAGKTTVAFERLEYNGVEYAVHTEINDEEQTVEFPNIRTQAQDAHTHSSMGAVGHISIIDTVSYTNLIAGKEYTVSGVLHIKDADGNDVGTFKNADGSDVSASVKFTPDSSAGTVKLTFESDVPAPAGAAVVAFEELSRNGITYAVHADINDQNQTVNYPWIGTTATDKVTGQHFGIFSATAVIVDEVQYHGLIPGKEYTMSGQIVSKADGKPVEGAAETVTFTPDSPDGIVNVEIPLDCSKLTGDAVVFESLSADAILIAEHADIADEGQTVSYPSIKTTATDKATGTHEGLAQGTISIVDVVEYHDLMTNREYTLVGTLHYKDDGKALVDANNNEIVSEAKFTPETASGTVEVVFEIPAELVAGRTVVAFETAYDKDVMVATHMDIEDEAQAVNYPKISTSATANGAKAVVATNGLIIDDAVVYENLRPGTSYTLEGKIVDKQTGAELAVTSQQFTPDSASGSVVMTFPAFDASVIGGHDVVTFEKVLNSDGKIIAVHEDINDTGQTVHLDEYSDVDSEIKQQPQQPQPQPQQQQQQSAIMSTGDVIGSTLMIVIGSVLAGLITVRILRRRH